jgi:hypothetical protein
MVQEDVLVLHQPDLHVMKALNESQPLGLVLLWLYPYYAGKEAVPKPLLQWAKYNSKNIKREVNTMCWQNNTDVYHSSSEQTIVGTSYKQNIQDKRTESQ